MSMNTSFFSREELLGIGFQSVGENVLISRFARFYSVRSISIGNHVRIDDFCILSGDINIGSYVHISAFCAMYGRFGITMGDYSGLSPRTTVFSATDDFSGDHLIGPMVPQECIHVIGGGVSIGKHCQLGASNVVLPAVTIGEGVATGALTLVNRDLNPWSVYLGIPARFHAARSRDLLKFVNYENR